jgi:hypothetical protein
LGSIEFVVVSVGVSLLGFGEDRTFTSPTRGRQTIQCGSGSSFSLASVITA